MQRVVILPCSGIGKALGTVSRQATYEVVEDLRPDSATTACLALLVKGEERTRALVRENPCIALDGCQKECARKNVELAGGRLLSELRVLDVYKAHKDCHPDSVLQIGSGGEKLVHHLAAQVAEEVDRLILMEGTGKDDV